MSCPEKEALQRNRTAVWNQYEAAMRDQNDRRASHAAADFATLLQVARVPFVLGAIVIHQVSIKNNKLIQPDRPGLRVSLRIVDR